jgi:transposase
MELTAILNRCYRFRGFVYEQARFSTDKRSIEVVLRPRKSSAAVCSRCHLPAPGYDQLAERRFEFIPLWGFFVFLLYAMRRVDCRRCGVVAVEEVPWGDGKRTLTKAYMLFLARWARRLSWKETAEAFRTSWDKVFDAVEHVVTWGLEHRTVGQIDAIGVDEIQYAKGHKYLTLLYQIDIGVTRLLWVGKERTIESFQGFFTALGQEVIAKISFVCSDMWEPYLKLNGEEPIMRRKLAGHLGRFALFSLYRTGEPGRVIPNEWLEERGPTPLECARRCYRGLPIKRDRAGLRVSSDPVARESH